MILCRGGFFFVEGGIFQNRKHDFTFIGEIRLVIYPLDKQNTKYKC
jgi:hypothetical protein